MRDERSDSGREMAESRSVGGGAAFACDAKNKTCRAAFECALEQTFIYSTIIHALHCCLCTCTQQIQHLLHCDEPFLQRLNTHTHTGSNVLHSGPILLKMVLPHSHTVTL